MGEHNTSNHTGPRRQAAEGKPYPYFVEHLEEIKAWLSAGFSVRSVWQIYSEEPVAFPGSYRSFLRYCRKHASSVPAVVRATAKAPTRNGSRGGSVIAQRKRYPAPLDRAPGFVPSGEA